MPFSRYNCCCHHHHQSLYPSNFCLWSLLSESYVFIYSYLEPSHYFIPIPYQSPHSPSFYHVNVSPCSPSSFYACVCAIIIIILITEVISSLWGRALMCYASLFISIYGLAFSISTFNLFFFSIHHYFCLAFSA